MATLTVRGAASPLAHPSPNTAVAAFTALVRWTRAHYEALVEARAFAERNRDAARLRRFAQDIMGEDPRQACDLLAAADRHEQG